MLRTIADLTNRDDEVHKSTSIFLVIYHSVFLFDQFF